jgi:hypothetical protein
MTVVNLTKQRLTLYDSAGEFVEIPPDPRHISFAGVSEHVMVSDDMGRTFSLNVQRVREIKGMPAPEEGILFIVPPEIAMALQEIREDVAFPAEEEIVRDADGTMRHVIHLRRVLSLVK